MMANILKMLHPFIPFFSESVWTKNNYKKIFKTSLILAVWPDYKKNTKYNKSQTDINHLIELITNIRSTKAELKVTPKLFCDVYFGENSSKLNLLVKRNITLVKQVGRINNILKNNEINRNTIKILVLNEKVTLKFGEDINFLSQKQSILHKLANLEKQTNSIKNKLNNKAYLKNAPKEIVQNDKNLLKELTVEDNKLRSIVSSIN
jgi:valyl-tRNA synthetase